MTRKSRTKANGEGTIFKEIKNGKTYYRGMLTIGYDEDGKLKRKSFTSTKKQIVIDKMADYKSQYNAGILPQNDKITLQQWFYTWLFDFRINDLKPSSLERYEGIYRNYIEGSPIGQKKLSNLRAADIQNYYNALIASGKTGNVVKSLNKCLKACINEAVKQSYIMKNYCNSVTLPRIQKSNDITVFTKEEQNILLNSLKNNELEMLITFDLGTGLRQGELLALEWSDINFKDNTVSVDKSIKLVYIVGKDKKRKSSILKQTPKTKSSIRTIPVPSIIMENLKTYKDNQQKIKNELYEDKNIVFANTTGSYLDSRYLSKRYAKLLKDANIPHKKFHALRHTYATRLFEADIPIKTVQVLMGHSDIKTTMNIYTHVMPEQKIKAVEKINNLFKL
ncbi:tyrosine-type recombinase/integrase [Clostridium ihumii]|uniref:tyrosine-type recombinase/integrase n=1 Tax=Clostridium ihumii TaxID=1470356 RepID=UPI00054D7FC5|nr:site-specific integrase [Clostridium ihumii]